MAQKTPKTFNTAETKTKLLSANSIVKGMTAAVVGVKTALEELHKWRVQTLLHAQKHGDYTLLERLTQDVMVNCPMIDMNAWRGWIEDHSPYRVGLKLGPDGKPVKDPETNRAIVEMGKKTKADGSEIKEGEAGYVPFQTEVAETKTLESDTRAMARGQRDLEPINVAWFKGQIARLKKQWETAQTEGNRPIGTKDPNDESKVIPMSELGKKQITRWLDQLSNTPLPDMSDVAPAQQPAAVAAAKDTGKPADELDPLRSTTRNAA